MNQEPETHTVKVAFIEEAKTSINTGKVYLRFLVRLPDRQFRVTAFDAVARAVEEKLKEGDEIIIYGYWKEWKGDQSFNLRNFKFADKGKAKTIAGSKRAATVRNLQETKEHHEAMLASGYIRGWEWLDKERGTKRYQWVKPDQVLGENQLRMDWLCDKLGAKFVSEELSAFLNFRTGPEEETSVKINYNLYRSGAYSQKLTELIAAANRKAIDEEPSAAAIAEELESIL